MSCHCNNLFYPHITETLQKIKKALKPSMIFYKNKTNENYHRTLYSSFIYKNQTWAFASFTYNFQSYLQRSLKEIQKKGE